MIPLKCENKSIVKKKMARLIGFIVFLSIAFKVFCGVTYLFRNTGYDRNHIVGIKSESDIDMVYVGGSAAFVYWEPLKAWRDCGFTSYSYATNRILAENIKAYMEEVRRWQNPDLYVIDVRAFQYYSDEPEEIGVRNGTDGMDLTSPARYTLLNDYFHNRTIDKDSDIVSYYFDIAKYHTNTANLGSSTAWGFINNEGTSPYKGWEWIDAYGYLEEPTDFETEERAVLPENAVRILNDLLAYCKRNDLDVLFVVCPYRLTREDQAKYNTVKDMVESEGYRFLNANEYYDEMDLDFSKDFYNYNHVSLFGAAKYTEFLEEYIAANYELPDHRDDSNYAKWDEIANRFFEEEKSHAEVITNLRYDVERTEEIIGQMREAESLSEWANLAADSRYTLLILSAGNFDWPENLADRKILEQWGIKETSEHLIRVINNAELYYSNELDNAQIYEGITGIWNGVSYTLSCENDNCNAVINKQNYKMGKDGLNIAVIDNNYQKLSAVFVFDADGEGNLKVRRGD